jgi:hypothetical protein
MNCLSYERESNARRAERNREVRNKNEEKLEKKDKRKKPGKRC